MSTKPLQLVGHHDMDIDSLQRRNRQLESEATELRNEIDRLEAQLRDAKLRYAPMEKAIAYLRSQLRPIHVALNMLFGAMDEAGVTYEVPLSPQDMNPTPRNKWEEIKRNMSPRHRDAIDLLLLQGRMNRKQMASALHTGYENCARNIVGPLIRQGWIIDNGGQLSLKVL